MLEQACLQWQRWQAGSSASPAGAPAPSAPLAGLPVSVNLSAAQLADPQLVPEIRQLLARSGMPAHALELELTESQLMENAGIAQQQLEALKALGVQLAIDDFGTGYSSLAYLKRFDLDKLKVDRSFVRDMLTSSADMAITRAIIALGHTLGLEVTAEGVEDLPTLQALRALDCDELQGFYFSRALPVDELEAWARAYAGQAAWPEPQLALPLPAPQARREAFASRPALLRARADHSRAARPPRAGVAGKPARAAGGLRLAVAFALAPLRHSGFVAPEGERQQFARRLRLSKRSMEMKPSMPSSSLRSAAAVSR